MCAHECRRADTVFADRIDCFGQRLVLYKSEVNGDGVKDQGMHNGGSTYHTDNNPVTRGGGHQNAGGAASAGISTSKGMRLASDFTNGA